MNHMETLHIEQNLNVQYVATQYTQKKNAQEEIILMVAYVQFVDNNMKHIQPIQRIIASAWKMIININITIIVLRKIVMKSSKLTGKIIHIIKMLEMEHVQFVVVLMQIIHILMEHVQPVDMNIHHIHILMEHVQSVDMNIHNIHIIMEYVQPVDINIHHIHILMEYVQSVDINIHHIHILMEHVQSVNMPIQIIHMKTEHVQFVNMPIQHIHI